MNPSTVLHVGCGHRRNGATLPDAFRQPHWKEVRLDIDPANEPDILGSMLDMEAIQDGSMDAVYSAHNIEHVYAHEVPMVLKEFLRVLAPGGLAVITCPDLQSVGALMAADRLTEVAYQSPAGAVSPLDMVYGWGPALAAGQHFMAHKCGFTLKSLTEVLAASGFKSIAGKRRSRALDLWVVAGKSAMGEQAIHDAAAIYLPS